MRPSIEEMNQAWDRGYQDFMDRFGGMKRYQWPYHITVDSPFSNQALNGNYEKGWRDAMEVAIQKSRSDATKNRISQYFQG